MQLGRRLLALTGLIAASSVGVTDEPGLSESGSAVRVPAPGISRPNTIAEARSRAHLLFELANGSLQVMHRDFFDDENVHAIPSGSLEDVFSELKKSFDVEMKWLNTGTDVVNTDHQAKSDFELQAARLLQRGAPSAELLKQGEYQFAGAVRLRSQCLKCHLKDRKSNEDRYAALIIKMQLDK